MYAAKDGFYLIDEFDNGLHYSSSKVTMADDFSFSKTVKYSGFCCNNP